MQNCLSVLAVNVKVHVMIYFILQKCMLFSLLNWKCLNFFTSSHRAPQ